MGKLNENMTRKHNWDQLQYIQKKIDKEGGDISKKLGGEYKNQEKTANSLWIDNPLKKDIDLSDNEPNANTHTDPQLKDLPKNSLIKEFKIFEKEQEEQEDRGNYNKIQRNMKTIRTWNNYYNDNVGGNSNPEKARNVLAGRQVKMGDDEVGYIEDFKKDGVLVQTIDNKGNRIVKFSEIIKNYKKDEDKEEKKEDLSLQGPNQENKIDKEEKSLKVKKLDDKGKEDKKTKNIADKIYKTKDIKLKKLNDFGKSNF
jgi:hypothetical protein